MLRGKKPEDITPRLKLMMFGPAGVGKTTAALNFPKAYVIDGEKGCQHYRKLVEDNGSLVFETTDLQEAIAEVKALASEPHEFTTLIVDPITTLYNDALEKAEKRVGNEFGRHFNEANKQMKRLLGLLMNVDMNVVITAHAKTEYGDNLKKLGETFDGYKKLDYVMDLVIGLERNRKEKLRRATVLKTRLEQFPDGEQFPWSYEEIRRRYDVSVLERQAAPVELATKEQVMAMLGLLDVVKLPEDVVSKWWTKAGVDAWEDMPAAVLAKCIEYVKNRLPSNTAA